MKGVHARLNEDKSFLFIKHISSVFQGLLPRMCRITFQALTGKPVWLVSEDMERDAFMSAAEAQAHGIVDLVAVAN
ncbi:hypothetical protein Ahy_B03g064994 [Arachis hypogaea]|uniref:ATP-dependent Clp protease proteolytic subunit n=1 Tax=Arachis hypogaea TaxID=3818 RepID=A0A445A0R1_ARAHY|nr:hypothetical protein Ahy_B03g064994 [Arachis hypogaea]